MFKYIALFFNILVSLILPAIILAILKKHSGKKVWTAAFWGAVGFVVLQLFIRIPLLQTARVQFYLAKMPVLLQYFSLAFTAGLFETVGRLLIFKLPLHKRTTYEDGLSAGIGHGWSEAAILVGINNILNTAALVLFQIGGSSLVAKWLPISAADAQTLVYTLNATPVSQFWAAGFERLFTMCAHTAFSLLLFYFMQRKQTIRGFFFVLGLHTMLDFFGVLLASKCGLLVTELFIAVFGSACALFCYKAKSLFKQPLTYQRYSQKYIE